MKALMLTLFFLLIAATDAKEYTRCELASLLQQEDLGGYYGYNLNNWVCMAFNQSGYNTQVVGQQNWDGSRDYGIFQINSSWWCNDYQGHTANGCNMPCSAFINDDITDDIICAKRIVRDPNRMNAWVAWKNNCKGKDLSQWTSDCEL